MKLVLFIKHAKTRIVFVQDFATENLSLFSGCHMSELAYSQGDSVQNETQKKAILHSTRKEVSVLCNLFNQ